MATMQSAVTQGHHTARWRGCKPFRDVQLPSTQLPTQKRLPTLRTISHSSSSDLPITSNPPLPLDATTPGSPVTNGVHPPSAVPASKPGFLQRIKEYFMGSKFEKAKLAELGMGAFASYGCISNVTYGACLTMAWVAFVKATGTTPLAPGQWKPFLAFYAGLWTIQNFVRPARFALAVALAPAFERAITSLGKRTGLPKPAAFGVMLAGIAAVTITGLTTAIAVFGGFPDGIPFLTRTAAA